VTDIQKSQNYLQGQYNKLSEKCQTNAEVSNQNAADLYNANEKIKHMTADMDYLHYKIEDDFKFLNF